MAFLVILGEDLIHIVDNETAVHVIVDCKYRRKTARTDAARCLERELAVGGDLARFDAQTLFQPLEDIARAFDIAGGAETY